MAETVDVRIYQIVYTKKDKKGHWVRLILTKQEAMCFEGSPLTYSPFCENNSYPTMGTL